MPSTAASSYSLVNQSQAVLYDDEDASEHDDAVNASAGAPEDDAAAWRTAEVANFDHAGRAEDLEDEELLDVMEREVAEYRQRRTQGRKPRDTAGSATTRRKGKRGPTPIASNSHILSPTAASKANAGARHAVEQDEEAIAAQQEEEARRRRGVRGGGKSVKAGNRLYHDAIGQRRRAEERAEKEQEKRRGSDTAECTFRPKVTAVADRLEDLAPVVERLATKDPNAGGNRGNDARDREDRELATCTFQPQVSHGSRRLTENAPRPGRVEDRLYREGDSRRLRQQLRERHMGVWEKAKAVGGRTISSRAADAAVERMYEWQRNKDDFLDLMRDELTKPEYDVHVDTAKVVARLTTPQYSGDAAQSEGRLYGPDADPRPLITPHSAGLATRRRHARYVALFRQFDSSNVGSVCLRTIEPIVSALQPRSVSVLAALRTASISEDQLVSFEEFVSCLDAYERRYGPQGWGSDGRGASHVDPAAQTQGGTAVPGGVRNDGRVHERLYKEAERRERVRAQLAQDMVSHGDSLDRDAGDARRPTITERGQQAQGRAVKLGATRRAGSKPGVAADGGVGDARASSAALRRDDGAMDEDDHVDGLSDVLAQIDDTLQDSGYNRRMPQRSASTNSAARRPSPTTASSRGLPPRSPSGSRRGRGGSQPGARGDGPLSTDEESGEDGVELGVLQQLAASEQRMDQLRREREQRLAAAGQAPRSSREGSPSSFPGQPDTYNLPHQTVQDLLYPVNPSTTRVSPHVAGARGASGDAPTDLRRFGKELMREQLREDFGGAPTASAKPAAAQPPRRGEKIAKASKAPATSSSARRGR